MEKDPIGPVAVPEIVAVPALPPAKARPAGNVPFSPIVGGGVPVIWIVKLVAVPVTAVNEDALVNAAGAPAKYASALAIAVPPASPPIANRVPPGKSTLAASARAFAKLTADAQVPAAGLYSSEAINVVEDASVPPAAIT